MKKLLINVLLISSFIFTSHSGKGNGVSVVKFEPYSIIKEITSRIIPEIIKKRELKVERFFIVNIVDIDSLNKRVEFSIDFICMDKEYNKVNPTSYFDYDSVIVLIKSNIIELISCYNFPELNENIIKKVKSKLFDTSDRLSYVSYKGLTVSVEYNNGIEKITYYMDELKTPLKYRKYDFSNSINNSSMKVYKTEDILKIKDITELDKTMDSSEVKIER